MGKAKEPGSPLPLLGTSGGFMQTQYRPRRVSADTRRTVVGCGVLREDSRFKDVPTVVPKLILLLGVEDIYHGNPCECNTLAQRRVHFISAYPSTMDFLTGENHPENYSKSFCMDPRNERLPTINDYELTFFKPFTTSVREIFLDE
ncbi:MAG: hypothetical protein V1659_06000 [Candidatus Woesearchaeota archaeon]